MVQERFAEANVLFVIDQLVKGVIRIVTGIVDFVAAILPVPGLEGLARFVRAVVRVAIGFVDEVILAHNIRVKSQNPYATAQGRTGALCPECRVDPQERRVAGGHGLGPRLHPVPDLPGPGRRDRLPAARHDLQFRLRLRHHLPPCA